MKIINPAFYQLKGVSPSTEDRKKEGASGPSFSEILENSSVKQSAHEPSAVAGSRPLGQVETLNPAQKEALAKGEEILGLLGHLGKMLEASDMSGSTARSAADALSSRVNELRLMRDNLDASDPLRDTLDEIGTISIVEQVKITRGDYG
jgi:hypothetical protein